jgi:hypothetical protein
VLIVHGGMRISCVKTCSSKGLCIVLGDLLVSVLAIGPKVCRFIPGRGRLKSSARLRFGGEVNPSATCRKILRHVKNPSKCERDPS